MALDHPPFVVPLRADSISAQPSSSTVTNERTHSSCSFSVRMALSARRCLPTSGRTTPQADAEEGNLLPKDIPQVLAPVASSTAAWPSSSASSSSDRSPRHVRLRNDSFHREHAVLSVHTGVLAPAVRARASDVAHRASPDAGKRSFAQRLLTRSSRLGHRPCDLAALQPRHPALPKRLAPSRQRRRVHPQLPGQRIQVLVFQKPKNHFRLLLGSPAAALNVIQTRVSSLHQTLLWRGLLSPRIVRAIEARSPLGLVVMEEANTRKRPPWLSASIMRGEPFLLQKPSSSHWS